MTTHDLFNKSIKELNTALKNFGSYTMYDKGIHEVMFWDNLAKDATSLSLPDFLSFMYMLLDHGEENHESGAELLASAIWMYAMEETELISDDEYEGVREKHPRLVKLY